MHSLVVTSKRPTARPTNPRLINDREMEALAYLCASPLPVAVGRLGRDLAYPGEGHSTGAERKRGHAICHRLLRAGWVVFGCRYELTERGRIAAALVMAKHPGLREAFFDE